MSERRLVVEGGVTKPVRVAFQGEPGAFSEEAAERYFAEPTAMAVPTWRGIFEAVRDGPADAPTQGEAYPFRRWRLGWRPK